LEIHERSLVDIEVPYWLYAELLVELESAVFAPVDILSYLLELSLATPLLEKEFVPLNYVIDPICEIDKV
jgi:hypothetical protein